LNDANDLVVVLLGHLHAAAGNQRQRHREPWHHSVDERFIVPGLQGGTHTKARQLALFVGLGISNRIGLHDTHLRPR
jgi:hypothetical protein